MRHNSCKDETPAKIGIIGYGYIGQALVARIRAEPDKFSLAFVHTRRREAAAEISDAEFLDDLAQIDTRPADLIVETAHPVITKKHGTNILKHADYMPLSTSALCDENLLASLRHTAEKSNNRLLLAAGALVGGEEMLKRSTPWSRARITFRKHPDNIDFSNVDISSKDVNEATVVFEGSVRDIAQKYPRNVNTMVTAALLTTGVDACEGVLVADPNLNCAIAQVEAWGTDGSYLRTEKQQPAKGVSGTEMIDSVWYSILRSCGISNGVLQLV